MKQTLLFSLLIFLLYIKNCTPRNYTSSDCDTGKCLRITLKNNGTITFSCEEKTNHQNSYYSIINSDTLEYISCIDSTDNCYNSKLNCNERKASSKDNMCCEIKRNEKNDDNTDKCIEININEFKKFQQYPKEYYDNLDYDENAQIICSYGSFIKMKFNYIFLNIITLITLIIG